MCMLFQGVLGLQTVILCKMHEATADFMAFYCENCAIFPFDCSGSVSYTHLDVYKRQPYLSEREAGRGA